MMSTSKLDLAKKKIRVQARNILKDMTGSERHDASLNACRLLASLPQFRRAQVILLYLPMKSEVDITPFALQCFRRQKIVCAPKIDWDRHDMSAVEINTFDDDEFGNGERPVRSPRSDQPVVPEMIDLVITPGLAFDTLGHRLGRGGGYYDRFLLRLRPESQWIGMAFHCQLLPDIPTGDNDISLDRLVTDRCVYRRGRKIASN